MGNGGGDAQKVAGGGSSKNSDGGASKDDDSGGGVTSTEHSVTSTEHGGVEVGAVERAACCVTWLLAELGKTLSIYNANALHIGCLNCAISS